MARDGQKQRAEAGVALGGLVLAGLAKRVAKIASSVGRGVHEEAVSAGAAGVVHSRENARATAGACLSPVLAGQAVRVAGVASAVYWVHEEATTASGTSEVHRRHKLKSRGAASAVRDRGLTGGAIWTACFALLVESNCLAWATYYALRGDGIFEEARNAFRAFCRIGALQALVWTSVASGV